MSRDRQGLSRRPGLEEILKKNAHVWSAYTSGRFRVREYNENSIRKIVLKEINQHHQRSRSHHGSLRGADGGGGGYNITKYRVRISRNGLIDDEDHILLVSFANKNQHASTQFEATLSDAMVHALPPPVLTRAIDISQNNALNSSNIVYDSAPGYYNQQQQPSMSIINSDVTVHPVPSSNAINTIADDYYNKLTGPGTDLIERLVEGPDYNVNSLNNRYHNRSQSATVIETRRSPYSDSRLNHHNDDSIDSGSQGNYTINNQTAQTPVNLVQTGNVIETSATVTTAAATPATVQDSFDDDYINHYAPVNNVSAHSSQLLRRASSTYTGGSTSANGYNYSQIVNNNNNPVTPSSFSIDQLSRLGFPPPRTYSGASGGNGGFITTASIAPHGYDPTAASLSSSNAVNQQQQYGFGSVTNSNVNATGSYVSSNAQQQQQQNNRISSRLSGSVRRVLNEFSDGPDGHQSRASSYNNNNLSPVMSNNAGVFPTNPRRSYSSSNTLNQHQRSLILKENESTYNSPSANETANIVNYNPFAFASDVATQNTNNNNSPVFTMTSAQSTPTFRQHQGSHYENESIAYQDYASKASERHQSVRKQFIRSGGQSAPRNFRRKSHQNENILPETQVNF